MNPLIKKEIRLLLPAWIAAMALAIVPTFIVWGAWRYWQHDWEEGNRDFPEQFASIVPYIVPLVFALGVSFLAINSFGAELDSGSFGELLSQPMERRRIWFVKVITLAVAFISVFLTAIILISWLFTLWGYSIVDQLPRPYPLPFLGQYESQAFEYLTLSALVAFGGGLWTTLLLRQTTGAFWFTLLTPLAIIMGLSTMLPDWVTEDQEIGRFIVVALVLYSVAGFFSARRLFMRAQDMSWAGGEISLLWGGKISGAEIIPISRRPRHWLFALAWKEIQLHQASLAIAAVLLVLHLACVVIRKIHPHFEGPDMQFVFERIWTLWLFMPLLIGATTIAEERRIGILELQLCMPVSRRAQFFIKFSVALVLSVFLGAEMPWLIEGARVLDGWIFVAAAGIFIVSFYASSLARTTLQAIGLTIVIAMAINVYLYYCCYVNFELWGNLRSWEHNGFQLYLTLSVLLIVLVPLAFWNFKRLYQSRELWGSNVITILAAFWFSYILDYLTIA